MISNLEGKKWLNLQILEIEKILKINRRILFMLQKADLIFLNLQIRKEVS
jgi:hypothetical protein